LQSLLEPYPEEQMESYPVSQRVNSPKNDDPSLIEPAVQG
jgi:putative SOS response-associated peptidase YedK